MTVQQLLREEGARLGVPIESLDEALRVAETLVTPGVSDREGLAWRELSIEEEEWVRGVFRDQWAKRGEKGFESKTKEIMGLN